MKLIELYQKHPIIVKAINFINLTNPSNSNPYHGIDHLFTVFKCSVNESELCECDKTLELYLAALFHDYGHKGKMGNDHDNIMEAIYAIQLFHNGNLPDTKESRVFDFDVDFAIALIQATEYPYVVEEKDLSLEAKILRDSDMSYMFEDLSIVKLYNGLRKEFGQDLNAFLTNQEKFLSNLKFYGINLQKLWTDKYKEMRLEELKLLKENI